MTKNTKKKLNPKHFRFLDKIEVRSPVKYAQYFYKEHDLVKWQEQIYLFLTSGSTYQRPDLYDPFHTYQHIINHIDIAYIIKLQFHTTEITSRFLNYFFEINSRAYWLEAIDELMKNAVDKSYWHDEDNYNRYLVRFMELLHYLSNYLYLLAIDKADSFRIPMYVLPHDHLTEEEKEIANCTQLLPLGHTDESDVDS